MASGKHGKRALFGSAAAAFALVVFAAPLAADIAPSPEYGQTLSSREANEVEMAGETVDIVLHQNKALVKAGFTLRNTGPATRMEVGFPDIAVPSSKSSDEPPEGFSSYKLRDFSVSVDGKVREFTCKYVHTTDSPQASAEARGRIASREREIEDLEKQLQSAGDEERKAALRNKITKMERSLAFWKDELSRTWAFLGWLVWDMGFDEGQMRTVEVSYWVPYRPRRADLLGRRDFAYILRTGAAWKGPIGRAQIAVKFGEGVSEKQICEVTPSPTRRSEEEISWDLRDFEPNEDIHVVLGAYASHKEAAAAHLAAYRERLAQGDKVGAMTHLLHAVTSQEVARLHEECIETCRKVIDLDKELEYKGATLVDPKARSALEKLPVYLRQTRSWGVPFFDPFRPCECRIVDCLRKLGRDEDARKAVPPAMEVLRALLGYWSRPGRVRSGLEKKLAEYRSFGEGIDGPVDESK